MQGLLNSFSPHLVLFSPCGHRNDKCISCLNVGSPFIFGYLMGNNSHLGSLL